MPILSVLKDVVSNGLFVEGTAIQQTEKSFFLLFCFVHLDATPTKSQTEKRRQKLGLYNF